MKRNSAPIEMDKTGSKYHQKRQAAAAARSKRPLFDSASPEGQSELRATADDDDSDHDRDHDHDHDHSAGQVPAGGALVHVEAPPRAAGRPKRQRASALGRCDGGRPAVLCRAKCSPSDGQRHQTEGEEDEDEELELAFVESVRPSSSVEDEMIFDLQQVDQVELDAAATALVAAPTPPAPPAGDSPRPGTRAPGSPPRPPPPPPPPLESRRPGARDEPVSTATMRSNTPPRQQSGCGSEAHIDAPVQQQQQQLVSLNAIISNNEAPATAPDGGKLERLQRSLLLQQQQLAAQQELLSFGASRQQQPPQQPQHSYQQTKMRTIFSCMWPECTRNCDSLEDIERHVHSHLGPNSFGDEDFYYEETEVDEPTYLAIFGAPGPMAAAGQPEQLIHHAHHQLQLQHQLQHQHQHQHQALPLSPSHNSDGLSLSYSFASSSPATSPVSSTDSSPALSSSCSLSLSAGSSSASSPPSSASSTSPTYHNHNHSNHRHHRQHLHHEAPASSLDWARFLASSALPASAKFWLQQGDQAQIGLGKPAALSVAPAPADQLLHNGAPRQQLAYHYQASGQPPGAALDSLDLILKQQQRQHYDGQVDKRLAMVGRRQRRVQERLRASIVEQLNQNGHASLHSRAQKLPAAGPQGSKHSMQVTEGSPKLSAATECGGGGGGATYGRQAAPSSFIDHSYAVLLAFESPPSTSSRSTSSSDQQTLGERRRRPRTTPAGRKRPSQPEEPLAAAAPTAARRGRPPGKRQRASLGANRDDSDDDGDADRPGARQGGRAAKRQPRAIPKGFHQSVADSAGLLERAARGFSGRGVVSSPPPILIASGAQLSGADDALGAASPPPLLMLPMPPEARSRHSSGLDSDDDDDDNRDDDNDSINNNNNNNNNDDDDDDDDDDDNEDDDDVSLDVELDDHRHCAQTLGEQARMPAQRRARGENRKCRKVYGMERRHEWCTQCKWKKACSRFCDQQRRQ